MKKMLLSMLVVFAFATVTFAQTPVADYADRKATDVLRFDKKLQQQHFQSINSKAVKSRWYDYANSIDAMLGGIAFAVGNNLFPDSTILVNYTSGYSGTWIHLLGNTLDPKSDWFNDGTFFPGELQINRHMPYTVDSVALQFYYWRNHPDPTIVDTLIIEVFTNNVSGDLPMYYFGPTSAAAANYGTDTVRFGAILFNASDLSSKASAKKTYKVLLTEAFANDTLADGTVVAYINTSDLPGVNPGGLVSSTAQFKPGYSWIPNLDTLTSMNRFFFLAYEENGEATWSNYTKNDYNASSIASPSSLDPASSWYEFQIPEWAFTSNTYGYENILFSYKLTADETGISAPTANIISLSQNQPNPFSDITSIRYTLSEMADVTLDLFDQTGRKVMNIKRGVEAPGMQSIDIDARNLQNGIYFYTLTAGNHKASKKMVVLK